jgi:hypothetical protein
VLTSISPKTAQVGSSNISLLATGSNFTSSSVVVWNTTNLATQFQSATSLQATVPASLLTTAGTAQVSVATGNLVSGSQTFTITHNQPTFTANPNPIISSTGAGMTTLTWNAPGYTQLVILVGSPTGNPMTGTLGSSGSEPTGDWVTDGLQFFLVDLTTNSAIANVTVHVSCPSCAPPPQPTLTANPNPIIVVRGSLVGTTTLTWNAPGYSNLVIHVNSPTGTALTGSLPSSGSTPTGNWVTNGMQFFLVDANSGTSLASVTVTVNPFLAMMTKLTDVAAGCSPPIPTTTFLTTDAVGYAWFAVDNAAAGDLPQVVWYSPGGVLYSTVPFNPVTAAGAYCFSDRLQIAGAAPATMPGAWQAVIKWNGSPMVSLPFTISSGN